MEQFPQPGIIVFLLIFYGDYLNFLCYTFTMKKSRKKIEKKQSDLRKKYLYLVLLLVTFILGVVGYFYLNRMPHGTSVEVAQFARLNAEVEDALYPDLQSPQSIPIPSGREVEITEYYLIQQAESVHSQVYAQICLDGETYYTLAGNLQLRITNPINQEVEQLGYPEFEVKQAVHSQFPRLSYWGGQPVGVLVHDTGNDGSTLENEIRYMTRNFATSGVFVHAFIDQQEIREIASTDFMAQGAGGQANPRFIQFELLRVRDRQSFVEETARAAYYTALMLRRHDLPLTVGQEDGSGTLWTHEMVSHYLGGTNHVDPRDYWSSMAEQHFQTTYTIENFKELVQVYYNKLKL